MDRYNAGGSLLLFIMSLFFITVQGKAQVNILVMSEKAEIYAKPVQDSTLKITARKGDIFTIIENRDGWIQIHMFSGAKRFIKSSNVQVTYDVPSYPAKPSIRSKLCEKANEAATRALETATIKYADNLSRQMAYEQMLYDQYLLNTFRKFDIPASHYTKLMECVDDGVF